MPVRILTLTANPALDIASTAAEVRPTHKIRTYDERYDAGGGGVNVARVLHELGADTLALITAGDVTGRLLGELLDGHGVAWQAVPISGRTRISYTVHDASDGEYRFVPPGPVLLPAEWQALLDQLAQQTGDWVVASGSLPPGVPEDFYARVADIAHRNGQKFALDSSGPPLRAALGHQVDLVKLSQGELEFLVGRKLSTSVELEAEISAMLARGEARAIAVSLGADGALLASADGLWRRPAASVVVRSAVGAGDSFLAGMVLSLARGDSAEQALRFATATAAVAVSRYGTAHVDAAAVQEMLALIA